MSPRGKKIIIIIGAFMIAGLIAMKRSSRLSEELVIKNNANVTPISKSIPQADAAEVARREELIRQGKMDQPKEIH